MHALTGELRGQQAPAPFGSTAWRPRLWQVWLVASAMLLLIGLPRMAHFAPNDPDDYMRLLQVRDWLGGQSWFDVHQYRMNPPAGADMHWSRLVDVPIAACLIVARLFLPERAAEIAAMTAVPLFQLLVAMVLMRKLLRELGASADAALAAAAMVPVFPLLTSNFLPMRIDHHGWQAVAALACAWMMVRGGYRAAFAAGLVTAVWLTVSLEGLPLAAVFGAAFAVRYWLWGRREHEAFLAALALASPLLFLATRPATTFPVAHCDMLSWPHFAAFAAGALVAAASRLAAGQGRALGRLAALAPVALAAGAAILLPLGACAIDPFAGLDPTLKHIWLDNVAEGLPITRQSFSVAAMLLWTIGLVLAGAHLALKQANASQQRERWATLALLALAAGAESLFVLRAALAAQLLAIPFAAILLMQLLPWARGIRPAAPRIVATLVCLGIATPVLASVALKPFDRWDNPGGAVAQVGSAAGAPCDLDRLNALPRAKLFAPLDIGPEILARTPHSVVMGPYHRNQARMRDVFNVFAGPLAGARDIVHANGANYLVACTDSGRLSVYAEAGTDDLASRLQAGRAPDWLEPVAGFGQGSLKVYKVR